jgi:hypothetical protein
VWKQILEKYAAVIKVNPFLNVREQHGGCVKTIFGSHVLGGK